MCRILHQRRLGLTKNPQRERRVTEFGTSEGNVWIHNIVHEICGKKILHLSSASCILLLLLLLLLYKECCRNTNDSNFHCPLRY